MITIESPNDIANQILLVNLEKLKKNANDLLKTSNPEVIHLLRVATRRLRIALKIFKKILPRKAKKIRAKLTKLGKILGKKRDLDIFSEFIRSNINKKSISFRKFDRKITQLLKQIHLILK